MGVCWCVLYCKPTNLTLMSPDSQTLFSHPTSQPPSHPIKLDYLQKQPPNYPLTFEPSPKFTNSQTHLIYTNYSTTDSATLPFANPKYQLKRCHPAKHTHIALQEPSPKAHRLSTNQNTFLHAGVNSYMFNLITYSP